MTDKFLLTVGIPVYNGKEAIRKTLDSLAPQLSVAGAGVEIVVSDNASTDGTPAAAREYALKYGGQVRVCENTENLGYDGNLEAIAGRAAGKYIWFLGCGEVVLPGALPRLVEKLKGSDYDNVLLNFNIETEAEPGVLQGSGSALSEETVFTSCDDFLKRTRFAITPLSANVVARSAWLRAAAKPLTVDGWAHVERILHILLDRVYQKSLFLPAPSFILFREAGGWWSRAGMLYRNSLSLRTVIAGLVKEGFSQETASCLLDDSYRALPRAIVYSKFHGLRVNAALLREASGTCGEKLSFWLLHLPLLLLPGVMFDNPAGRRLFSAAKQISCRRRAAKLSRMVKS